MRSILLLILLLFQLNSLKAQKGRGDQTFNTILFKVSSSENDRVSYLFGTHHAFGKSFFDTLSNATQALLSSNLLIKENLNIPGEMAEDLINRRSTTTKWNKLLQKEDLSFIEALFASSPTDYHKMTPAELYTFLNRYFKQQVCLNKGHQDTSLSLDDYIGSIATSQNIDLMGLETTEDQINLINKDVEGMPIKNHKRRLSNIISKIRDNKGNDCEETDWYSQMEMDYQLNAPCGNALILTDRNNQWMMEIQKKLESNNCFIAVGLSHLMYECGLINQLKKRGYSITPIGLK